MSTKDPDYIIGCAAQVTRPTGYFGKMFFDRKYGLVYDVSGDDVWVEFSDGSKWVFPTSDLTLMRLFD